MVKLQELEVLNVTFCTCIKTLYWQAATNVGTYLAITRDMGVHVGETSCHLTKTEKTGKLGGSQRTLSKENTLLLMQQKDLTIQSTVPYVIKHTWVSCSKPTDLSTAR